MEHCLEEVAGLRKAWVGRAAPHGPLGAPTSRRRCLASLWCVCDHPQANTNPSPPMSARPRGSCPCPHPPWLPEHQPPGAASSGGGRTRAGDSQDTASLRHPRGTTKASSRAPHRGAGGSLARAWPFPLGPVLPYVRRVTLFSARRLLPVNCPVFPEALLSGRDAEPLRGPRELPRAEGRGVSPSLRGCGQDTEEEGLFVPFGAPQCPAVRALKSWAWAHVHAG